MLNNSLRQGVSANPERARLTLACDGLPGSFDGRFCLSSTSTSKHTPAAVADSVAKNFLGSREAKHLVKSAKLLKCNN